MKIGLVGCGVHGVVFSFLAKRSLPAASITIFEASSQVRREKDQLLCLTDATNHQLRELKLPRFHIEPSKIPIMYDSFGNQLAEPPYLPLHLTSKNTMLDSLIEECKLDLRLSSRVSKLDKDIGEIELENGEKHEFDLVVVADGYNSISRTLVHQLSLKTLAWSAWSKFKIDKPFEFYGGDGWSRVTVFPFNGETFVRIVLPVNCLKYGQDQSHSIAHFTLFQVRSAMTGYPRFIHDVLKYIDEERFFDDPAFPNAEKTLSRFASGKVVLLGEACHRLGDMHILSCNPGFDDAITLANMLKEQGLEAIPNYTNERKTSAKQWHDMAKAAHTNLAGENSGLLSSFFSKLADKRWNAQYGDVAKLRKPS